MRQFYAYLYRDPKTGIPVYVGKGYGNRAFDHFKSKTRLGNMLRKRIAEGFKVEPEFIVFGDEELAFFVEQEAIRKYGRDDLGTGTLFNLTDGGEGQSNPSPEVREKISKAAANQIHSPERNAKIGAAHLGIPTPENICTAISKTLSGRIHSSDRVQANRLGRRKWWDGLSEDGRAEYLRRQSEAKTGKKLSPEHGAAISASLTGFKRPPRTAEHKAKHAAAIKRNRLLRLAQGPLG